MLPKTVRPPPRRPWWPPRHVVLAGLAVVLYLLFHRSTSTSPPAVANGAGAWREDEDVVVADVADPPREELEEDDAQPDFPDDVQATGSTSGVVEEPDDVTLQGWEAGATATAPEAHNHGQVSFVGEDKPAEEWSRLVHEAVRDTTKLVMDVYFHRLTDAYGLIDLRYPESDILKIFERVVEIWAQANIHVRFWLPESLRKEPLSEGVSDAYKVYVTGSKEEDSPELLREKAWLSSTSLGKEKTEWMYGQMLSVRPNSCCSVEKMIVGSAKRTRWQKQNTISFYPMHYLRWYNGFSLDRMVVIRGGSCWTPENKLLDGKPVVCKLGYKDGIGPLKRRNPNSTDFSGARDWERFPFTWKQFARIAAHEIGHYLGLGHWNGGRCTKWDTIQEANLMSQQKRVAIPGFPCGMQNRFSEDAVFLSKDQIATARSLVKHMDAREVPTREEVEGTAEVRRMGQSMEQETETRAKPDVGQGLILQETAPCNGRVARVRFKFHELVGEEGAATDPAKRAHFAVFAGEGEEKPGKPGKLHIRAFDVVRVSTKPYAYQRHLWSDCNVQVRRGDVVGVVPIPSPPTSGSGATFPIAVVAKALTLPQRVYFRRVRSVKFSPPSSLTVVSEGAGDDPDAFVGLAPFVGLDVVCDGG